LPAVARDLAREAADALDGPVDYVGHAALAVAGAAAGAAVELEVKAGWRERACLFAALVGPSGSAKTPSLQQVASPTREAQAVLAAAYERDRREHDNGYRAWVRGGRQGDEPRRPVLRRLIGSDLTTACLAPLLAANPRGLLVTRDELRGWLASMDEFGCGGGGDRTRWLSLWSGDSLVVDRRGVQESLLVDRPFVAVVGGLVPSELRQFANPRRARGGTPSRTMMVCWPGSPSASRPPTAWADSTPGR
jgi:hypothetical protein